MAGIRNNQRFADSQMFWLSLFLFLGTVSGTVFCNRMSDDMKQTLGTYLFGVLTPAEFTSVDRYRLCVGVLKKRFVWLLSGLLIDTASRPVLLFGIASAYLSFRMSAAICVLTMHAGTAGILHALGLVFPQGIAYGLAGYLLWIGIWKEDRRENGTRRKAYACLVALGALAEIFVNPACSAWIFRTF